MIIVGFWTLVLFRRRYTTNHLDDQDFVLSVALTPDGQWVLSGSKDRGVHFWDPTTGTAQLMLQGHKNSGGLAFNFSCLSNFHKPCTLILARFCFISYFTSLVPSYGICSAHLEVKLHDTCILVGIRPRDSRLLFRSSSFGCTRRGSWRLYRSPRSEI